MQVVFVCFLPPVVSTGVDVHSISVRMPKLAVVLVVGAHLAGSPIKAAASATEQIANIACLAFSRGNKPIDFFGSALCFTYTDGGAEGAGGWGCGALVKGKLTGRWRGGEVGCVCACVCVGSGGRKVRVVLSMGISRWRAANQLQISEVYKSNGGQRGGKYDEVVKKGRKEGREGGRKEAVWILKTGGAFNER